MYQVRDLLGDRVEDWSAEIFHGSQASHDPP
jgi:hypothetical protein